MMARVRFFGPLRDVTGTGVVEVEATSLRELTRTVALRYGDDFTAMLPTCRVWLNGDEANLNEMLNDGDEVAFLPPGSGG
jgi:molybdopterin synthase sulfur carrier subunit